MQVSREAALLASLQLRTGIGVTLQERSQYCSQPAAAWDFTVVPDPLLMAARGFTAAQDWSV